MQFRHRLWQNLAQLQNSRNDWPFRGATFCTTGLDNCATFEDVQRAAGHRDPSTAKLYDRRGYNPEKSASFFANY